MEKRMDLSEKQMSTEINAENEEYNREMFVRRVATSGLVLKFKVDKYGTLPSTHTISSQKVLQKPPPGATKSEISAAEATRSNKISLFDNDKVAPTDETVNHICNECGKGFKEMSSLHGHKGVHRREEYKRKRMMLEQQPITMDASHVVSSQKPGETNKDEIKNIRSAAQTLYRMSMEFKRHRPDDLSASMTIPYKHISAEEITDDMREVAQILVTLAQSFCMDITMHMSLSASTANCFVCTTCNKVFSSYYALGGHMSIHNKKPTKNSLLEDGGVGSSRGGRKKQSTWKHVCDKCNMKFATGQILGGHKRGHWWEEYYKMTLLEGRNVKPPLPMPPHHEAERSGLVVVPTDENIEPAGTGLVVAAHTVPLACDGVQQTQQAMSLGNDQIDLPMPSGVSDKDVPSDSS